MVGDATWDEMLFNVCIDESDERDQSKLKIEPELVYLLVHLAGLGHCWVEVV